MKIKILGVLTVILALSLTACPEPNPDPDPEHTHTYATTWSSDDTQHWHECTAHDGAKTDVAPHDWEWQETTPATTTADGEETETCKICGAASGDTRPIAQLQPQLCACLTTYGTTAHLGIDANGNVVACTCGGTNCSNCTEQTDAWNNIPIRKSVNVSVKQMNDTVATIKGIMDDEGYQDKDMFEAKGLTAIHIVSGDEVNFQNGILTVGCDAEFTDILFKFDDIYNGIAQIQQHPPQTITFGTDLSTTVTGPAMTGTQWNAVIANLTAALNAAANDGDVGFYCTALFTTMGATINLVKTQEYNYYSLDLTNITASKISLNTDYVIGASQADLSEKVLAVVNAVAGQAPIQAKAPAHDNGLERLNRRIS